jgi:hypothetical protein
LLLLRNISIHLSNVIETNKPETSLGVCTHL